MNPSMLQLSKVVHDERLQEAARLRQFSESGTVGSDSSERGVLGLGQFLSSLGSKLNPRSHSGSAAPTSHLS